MTIDFSGWEGCAEPSSRDVMPAGAYLLTVETFMEDVSKNGKLMYPVQLRVVEPAEHANRVLFEQFVIGSDDDLLGDDPATWQKNGGRMMRMFRAAGLALNIPVSALGAQVVGQRVVGVVSLEIEREFNRDGSKNQYAGNKRNRVGNYYLPGEREVRSDADAKAAAPHVGAPGSPTRAATAPAPARAAGRPAKAAAEVQFKCPLCGKSVPRSEYGKHADGCTGTGDAPQG